MYTTLEPAVRVDENLRVSVDSLVKLLVSSLGIVDVDLMRDDKTGLRLSCDNQVTQVAVVRLDVALPCAERQSLIYLAPRCHSPVVVTIPFQRACRSSS